MSRVVLVRHGPVACDRPLLPDRAAFQDFCALYEKASLAPGAPPPGLCDLCRGATLFTSVAPRARQTAMRLAPQRQWRFDPLFAEEPLTAPDFSGRWPLALWFALARGREIFASSAEPQRRARKLRAEQAAQMLVDAAPSLLVGHGWFNRQIAAALIGMGYRAGKTPESGAPPWGARTFLRG